MSLRATFLKLLSALLLFLALLPLFANFFGLNVLSLRQIAVWSGVMFALGVLALVLSLQQVQHERKR